MKRHLLDEKSHLSMKGHPYVDIYTGPHSYCNHLIFYILIQLLCYPDGFLYNVPNILDVCSLNRIGSLRSVSESSNKCPVLFKDEVNVLS